MARPPRKPDPSLDLQVVDALIEATSRLLQEKSRADITVREIALAANVNPAMINYYFQHKSNLFLVFIEHLVDHNVKVLGQLATQLEAIDPARDDPTRMILTTLADAFSHNATGLRLLTAEIQLNSELKQAYNERHVARTTTVLKRILQRLVERGIYRADLQIDFTAFTVETLMSRHVVNNSVMKAAFNLDPGPETTAAWIDYLVEIFSPAFRANLGITR